MRIKISLTFIFVLLSNSCSKSNMSGTYSPTEQFISERDYLAGLDRFPTTLTGRKDGAYVVGKITFAVSVEGLKKEDLYIENGRVTELSGETKEFTYKVQPLTYGEVSIVVPRDVATNPLTAKKNERSNTIKLTFTDMELDASLKLVERKILAKDTFDPTELILIVDDSSSMRDKQVNLTQALESALHKLEGRDIKVFLYSTTQFGPGFNSNQSQFFSGGVGIHANYTGTYATGFNQKTPGLHMSTYGSTNTITSWNSSKAPALNKITHFLKKGAATLFTPTLLFDHDSIVEKFVLAPSGFNGGAIELKSSMNKSQFNAAIATIKNTIVNLGEGGASTAELPLCTLYTILANEGPNAILNSQVRRAFLILTDEDQTNLPCLSGYSADLKKLDFYRAYVDHYYKRTYIRIESLCDSGSANYCTQSVTVLKNADCIDNGINKCLPRNTNVTCDQEHSDYAYQTYYDIYKSRFESGLYRMPQVKNCYTRVIPIEKNFPHQFDSGVLVPPGTECNGSNFTIKHSNGTVETINQSLSTYLKAQYPTYDTIDGQCNFAVSGFAQTNAKFIQIPGIAEHGSLKNLIRNTANSLLGQNNYMIAAIANLGESNPAGCTALLEHKSKQVIDVADNGKVLSICQPSYDQALVWFDNFVKYKPQEVYDLKSLDILELVSIKFKKMDAALMPTQYKFENGILTFLTDAIQIDDVFELKFR